MIIDGATMSVRSDVVNHRVLVGGRYELDFPRVVAILTLMLHALLQYNNKWRRGVFQK